MARTKISEFSSTAADNTDIDGIDIAEGCAPSGINNAIRTLMADLKDMQTGASGDTFTFASLNATTANIDGGTIDGATIGGSSAAAGTFTSLSDSGNLTFTGTGNRITGDFSNATVANRVAFQSSTTNGVTQVTAMPNGTATQAQFTAVNGTDLNNTSGVQIRATATEAALMGYNTGSGTTLPLTFYTSGSERVRIDTSGNVGIGLTPTSIGRVQILAPANSTSLVLTDGTQSTLQINHDPTNLLTYRTVGSASQRWVLDTTERMRIDSSGNVGIGTSVNSVFDAIASARPLLVQSGSSSTTVAGSSNSITICNSDTTTNNSAQINFSTITGASANQYSSAVIAGIFGPRTNGQYPTGQIAFCTSTSLNSAPSEKMRLTSAGSLFIGTTTSGFSSTNYGIQLVPNGESVFITNTPPSVFATNRNTDGDIMRMGRSGSIVGQISVSSTSTTYGTSSDYRLKELVAPMTGALAKNELLNPVTYKWKVDGSDGQGFIAHELQAVFPDAVTGEKDAVDAEGNPVYQGVDTSFLVGHLVACVKELTAELNNVKAELAILKGN